MGARAEARKKLSVIAINKRIVTPDTDTMSSNPLCEVYGQDRWDCTQLVNFWTLRMAVPNNKLHMQFQKPYVTLEIISHGVPNSSIGPGKGWVVLKRTGGGDVTAEHIATQEDLRVFLQKQVVRPRFASATLIPHLGLVKTFFRSQLDYTTCRQQETA